MERWDFNNQEVVTSPENVEQFLEELETVCKKYNFSISYEELAQSFVIVPYSPKIQNELKAAWLNL